MSTEEMVIQARELSKLIHQEQTDQEGNPHYEYLNALAEDCYFDEMKAVAYLQDAVEHQPDRISAGDIRRQFGDEIGDAVDAITRRPRERSEDYYVRLKQNPLALGVKMKDLRRRIADLEKTDADENVTRARREAYQASLNYFMN
ncbi:MAG: guanosine-3',5'-bis(diphosphate) 3'-pyrophosphohydrolase [Clostridiales bacterium]|nr:guanosine-3',5'-bis(diphosphate) 3'-pyrophosphohydrolase [Clostridiales bacterium]NLM86808.1 guanosine-3',5'-bis(diphosphate) 3'-pyrophosphohydrolase [Clostridiales bacterium]